MSFSRPLANKSESLLNFRPTSPIKSGSHTLQQLLPLKKRAGLGSWPKKSQASTLVLGPSFFIYHDPPSPTTTTLSPLKSAPIDERSDDKENILQPKVMELPQQSYTCLRRALATVSLHKFPGYLSSVDQLRLGCQRLMILYQPKNSQNSTGSLHKFNALPSFVTPPRNALNKILYRSRTGAAMDEVDEIEQMLIKKLREARRKRAMSVGANRGRLHLVQKPQFKIGPL